MKIWPVKVIWFVIMVEIIYLLLVNIALNLPQSQLLINAIKPQKFTVHWAKAWSFFPFRFYAENVSATGKVGTRQWVFESPSLSGAIGPQQLLRRKLHVTSAHATHVRFSLQQTGESITDAMPDNEDLNFSQSNIQTSEKIKKSWAISVDPVIANGNHEVIISNKHSRFTGTVVATVNYQTRGGPFSIENGQADVDIRSLAVDEAQQRSSSGTLKGQFSIEPYVPSQHRGKKSLKFLSANADIRIESDDLSYLSVYLDRFKGMALKGSGQLEGKVDYHAGAFRSPTDINVVAPALTLELLNYKLTGKGNISIKVESSMPDHAITRIQFDRLIAGKDEDVRPLFEGSNLVVTAIAPSLMPIDRNLALADSTLSVTLPKVTVPDIAVYQSYLPEALSLQLLKGSGHLQGTATLTNDRLALKCNMTAPMAEIALDDYGFTTGLDVLLNLRVSSVNTPEIDISGTRLALKDSRLDKNDSGKSESFTSVLNIERGLVGLDPNTSAEIGKQWLGSIKRSEFQSLLANANADLLINGELSSLEWINHLIGDSYGLSIAGSGRMEAALSYRQGAVSTGTDISIHPGNLSVEFLDYVVQGTGDVTMRVERGGKSPDLGLSVNIVEGDLRRNSDEKSFAHAGKINLDALIEGVSRDAPPEEITLNIAIPSAVMEDMTVYNDFLPANTPLSFVQGKAELVADIELNNETASGTITLDTSGLETRIDEQIVAAEVSASINIEGGTPEAMQFDISGSKLLIDRVRVDGKTVQFRGDSTQGKTEPWTALLTMDKANVIWRKPLEIDMEAALQMTDSRPFLAVMNNHSSRLGWLDKTLTVENVEGRAALSVKDNQIMMPMISIEAGDISLAAKGIINADQRDGMIYARYKKLKGLLKISGEKRNLDVLRSKQQFDAYTPGSTHIVKARKNPDELTQKSESRSDANASITSDVDHVNKSQRAAANALGDRPGKIRKLEVPAEQNR